MVEPTTPNRTLHRQVQPWLVPYDTSATAAQLAAVPDTLLASGRGGTSLDLQGGGVALAGGLRQRRLKLGPPVVRLRRPRLDIPQPRRALQLQQLPLGVLRGRLGGLQCARTCV